ncbi:hypothetical protein PMAYCL1PPCAC_18567, partial [Pristionchus mayeri]
QSCEDRIRPRMRAGPLPSVLRSALRTSRLLASGFSSMLDRERTRGGSKEKLVELLKLFEQKLERMKGLVETSPEYREREELIGQLQKCVENRDEIIQSYADNLRGAEQVLTKEIFQVNSCRISDGFPLHKYQNAISDGSSGQSCKLPSSEHAS